MLQVILNYLEIVNAVFVSVVEVLSTTALVFPLSLRKYLPFELLFM